MTLAGMLVADGESEPALDAASEVRVKGPLAPFDAPWQEHVAYALSGTTYIIDVDGVDDLVLLTGMEPGWGGDTVVAEAEVILRTPHPEEDRDVVVLAVTDVDEPVFG